MKVLIVKTSSLGDIVHALPAVTEASHFLPSIQFDWLVEEAFCPIPSVHPSINNIIQFFNKPNSKSFEFKVKKKYCGSCENCPFSIKNKS